MNLNEQALNSYSYNDILDEFKLQGIELPEDETERAQLVNQFTDVFMGHFVPTLEEVARQFNN